MDCAFTPWFNVLKAILLQNFPPGQEVSDVLRRIEKQMFLPKVQFELLKGRSDGLASWASNADVGTGGNSTRRSWHVDGVNDNALKTSTRTGCTQVFASMR